MDHVTKFSVATFFYYLLLCNKIIRLFFIFYSIFGYFLFFFRVICAISFQIWWYSMWCRLLLASFRWFLLRLLLVGRSCAPIRNLRILFHFVVVVERITMSICHYLCWMEYLLFLPRHTWHHFSPVTLTPMMAIGHHKHELVIF